MEIRVLGALEVLDDRGPVGPIASRNQQIVLSVLAADAGRIVSAERLVEALWGPTPPKSARATLRTYVSRLRRHLDGHLVIHPGGYELRAEVDATALERAVSSGTGDSISDAESARAALDAVDGALSHWRGPPFAGLEEVLELEAARTRMVELRRVLEERRTRALAACGRPAEAAVAAEALLAEDPWREHVWVTLVEALTVDGRAAEALRAAQRARDVLAEAGLEPGPRLRRAETAALDAGTITAAQPASGAPVERAGAAGTTGRVPHPATGLVGRDQEVEELLDLVHRHRLVTLLGPGGVGKTRLAVEVGHRLAPRHELGARMVALESVVDPADVGGAVLDALGLGLEAASVDDQLASAGALDLLVVLDNCEHVVDAAADVVHALVTGGPRVRVVATSRERLNVPGEQVSVVRPLRADTSGRALLVERARGIRPDVELSDPALLDRIVARLDGLPLAIEMAASRLATCSVEELADRLDRELSGLDHDLRGAPDRHRSMAQMVRWTTDGLAPPDRRLFGELSVFASTIEPAAAAAVTGREDAPAGLRRLALNCLVSVEDLGAATGFRMLAPVRACAIRQLVDDGRLDELSLAHARYTVDSARRADRALRTSRQGEVMAHLDRLVPDVRGAYRWSLGRDPALAVALCSALHLYAQIGIRIEIWGWADELVRLDAETGLLATADPDEAATVLACAAHASVVGGDLTRGRQLATRAMELARSDEALGAAAEIAADVAMFRGRLAESRALAGSLEVVPDDPHLASVRLLAHILAAAYEGNRGLAEELLERGAQLPLESATDRAWMAYAEGEVLADTRPQIAIGAYERAVALADAVGDRYVASMARLSMGALSARHGSLESAVRGFVEAIDHWRRHDATTHLVTTLRNLPALLRRLDRPTAAAELLAGLDHAPGPPPWGVEHERLETARGWVRERLDEAALDHAAAIGHARTLDEVATAARDALT